ncbi:MAG: sigma-54 dependent transcriptional regulator, partial [Pseudomonadota bacterium]
EAHRAVNTFYPDVVLIDLKLPDADGTVLLSELLERYPRGRYIIITAFGSIRSAVESTRLGACDYLTKPFEPDELLVAVRNALRDRLREEEISVLRSGGSRKYKRSADQPVGMGYQYKSEAMRGALNQAEQAAQGDSIVLLLGESGSGKDVLARYIHDRSRRSGGPFFALNCAAVSSELAESELFGHEPGAFTGARGRKRGLLELAEGGTLLLNEIGELSMTMQAKLLTFLDTRTFTRVGGESQIRVNARLIAATNRDLETEAAENRFRRDLYYRLNVISILVPPLRSRQQDLPTLVTEVLECLADDLGLPECPKVDQPALDALAGYHWPGNVRELRNVLERALMLSGSRHITVRSLGFQSNRELWSYSVTFPQGRSIHDVARDMRRSLVLEALRRSGGSKRVAAELLGISRHALAYQMKSVGLDE